MRKEKHERNEYSLPFQSQIPSFNLADCIGTGNHNRCYKEWSALQRGSVHGIGVWWIYVKAGHGAVVEIKRRGFAFGGFTIRAFFKLNHFLFTECLPIRECDSFIFRSGLVYRLDSSTKSAFRRKEEP
jgi:hypothetical protein